MESQVISLSDGRFILQNDRLSAWIAPQHGFNTERLLYQNVDIIECDMNRAKKGATYAIPILYPTPNRVRNGRFCFEGRNLPGKMHGTAHLAPFIPEDYGRRSDGTVFLTAYQDYLPGTALFEEFPYNSRLTITFSLHEDTICWEYTVSNQGDCNLPYSFALHPFFLKHGETQYQLAAFKRMDMDPSTKFPSGKLVELTPPIWNVHQLRPVETAALDDVFCVEPSHMASILYCSGQFGLDISASSEFGRCVVYTPKEKDWFCIEPQTSSTDCHNLYTAGFIEAANLQIVPPHTEKTGSVQMKFKTFFKGDLYE